MKLKDYLKKLNALAKDRPELLGMDVITMKDNVGSGYTFLDILKNGLFRCKKRSKIYFFDMLSISFYELLIQLSLKS